MRRDMIIITLLAIALACLAVAGGVFLSRFITV